jgi:DNA-binding transcriptional MocR family regulator
MLTIPIDEHGIIPSELEKVIENHFSNPKSTPIKFLYLVPTGHNPSGATMTVERKKAVLALAKKYNFLILEDDPYFYLNLEHRVDGKPLDSGKLVFSTNIRNIVFEHGHRGKSITIRFSQ